MSEVTVQPKVVFISHNKADKLSARILATALVQQGVGVWFDEWEIMPGDSIIGGIEKGVSEADTFVLVWSSNASKSKWVGTEVRAYLYRRVEDESLRIIPVMLDSTPLPVLVADYRGFRVSDDLPLERIAVQILGTRPDREIARLLQNRLLEITAGRETTIDPLPYLVCPRCGSTKLERRQVTDYERDDMYIVIWCTECEWRDETEI
jgi:hypothetical protein